ncbi:MAG: (2Fe-2S)-binding protein [Candidatus Latescibacterota bacterium]|nr:(2Fe-2S)-binding protein [Candidatus Latescibacterota bacterium]
MKHNISMIVNGQTYEVSVEPRKTLLSVLRDQLHLTGTKEGCSTGDCGACTIIMDGATYTSCLVLGVEANGRDITTVEGIAEEGKLHPVQESFVKKGGLQCGFCTAGLIVSSAALLNENPDPSEDDVQTALAGNLCRCTGYTKITEALKDASKVMKRRATKKKVAK